MPKASTSRRPEAPERPLPVQSATRMYDTTTCFKTQEAMTEIKAIISQEIKIKRNPALYYSGRYPFSRTKNAILAEVLAGRSAPLDLFTQPRCGPGPARPDEAGYVHNI